MMAARKMFAAVFLFALALGPLLIPQRVLSDSSGKAAQAGNTEPVPAYHNDVPSGPLPATMDPSQFDKVVVQNAYSVAAHIKKILYQEPCYCHCDRNDGHGSLLDCFVSNHTAGCGVCLKEVFYTHEQSRKGKTATEIREAIEQGEWKQLDLKKYDEPLPAK
jgi:hypothetical protein